MDPEPLASQAPVAAPGESAPSAGDETAPSMGAPASVGAAAPSVAAAPSRRRFLRWLAGLTIFSTLAMVLTPVVGFLVPSKEGRVAAGGKTLVGTTADIPAGGGKVVAMGSKPAIVVNTDQGVKAFSAICPHLGCVVAWNDLIGAIQCPCHDGRFNPSSGAVISGPPPGPLPPINVSVEGDQIFLSEA